MPDAAYLGRLAPSPTGLLHLGHAATFLTAFDRAQAAEGRLLLRIDDLDRQRSREEFVEAAREDLRWLGCTWEAEVRQSLRLARYQDALQTLLTRGLAYPCTCSRRDLREAVQAPHEETDDEPVYSGRCRPLQNIKGVAAAGAAFGVNYRIRVPDSEDVTFEDGNFGPQRFAAGIDFGDFLVWRKDGLPSYQLATVVDDFEMGITEVVRGRDLLKSTARQIVLQRALGLPTPRYFHTALLRDEHGVRLAKRNDALSLRSLRAAGARPGDLRARVAVLLHHKA
jgi:glutamyl/glutaminyl-tRNA synthetase